MFMISSDTKTRILSVVNIFETGTADGVYGNVSIYHDGKKDENGQITRQITYGRSQTTEQGNLKDLIAAYIANKGVFAADFQPYMPKLGVTPLVDDQNFINLLKKAAKDDPIMTTTQDEFFDKDYYLPAFKFFTDNGFIQPLSMLVIYDSYIHSGSIPDFLRKRFPEVPPVKGGDEKEWIEAYVKVRHDWLVSKPDPLDLTVYRTETFLKAIEEDNWNLGSEIFTQGVKSRDIDAPPPIFVKLINVSKTLFMVE